MYNLPCRYLHDVLKREGKTEQFSFIEPSQVAIRGGTSHSRSAKICQKLESLLEKQLLCIPMNTGQVFYS